MQFLIDFDCLIKYEETTETTENDIETKDFYNSFAAPETHKTYKSDIYSLGQVINHILNDEIQEDNYISDINSICQLCLNEKEEERPNISTLIYLFYVKCLSNIHLNSDKRKKLVTLLEKHFIKESELFDLFTLYLIYSEGRYISKDENKAKSYFSQIICKFSFMFYPNINLVEEENCKHINASEIIVIDKYQKKGQNYFILCFDSKIIIIKRNPKEETEEIVLPNILEKHPNFNVYYLQNILEKHTDFDDIENKKSAELECLFHIQNTEFKIKNENMKNFIDIISGCLFSYLMNCIKNKEPRESNYDTFSSNNTYDFSNTIHFLFGSNQNDLKAQFDLGFIFHEGKYVMQNIDKAIHYYSLAANQNFLSAQLNLDFIYSEGEYVTPNIGKAIHYFSLAANQKDPRAQFNLGLIYYEGKYVKQDINKAIHYYSLAANQKYSMAQYNLGLIYYEGKYITRDIKKQFIIIHSLQSKIIQVPN